MLRLRSITDDRPWLRYVITAAVGLLITLGICLLKGVFRETDGASIVRYLSDAFLIPGVLFTGIGLLSFLKKEGTYDGLGYTFHTKKRTFTMRRYMDPIEEGSEGRTYFDYKQQMKAKRKVSWHLIVVGVGFLLVAVALAVVHSKAF